MRLDNYRIYYEGNLYKVHSIGEHLHQVYMPDGIKHINTQKCVLLKIINKGEFSEETYQVNRREGDFF